jgi:hypothetical protein
MVSRRQFLTGLGALGLASLDRPNDVQADEQRTLVEFPHRKSTKPRFVQPDYEAWQKATEEGLSEAEVLTLLGQPIDREKPWDEAAAGEDEAEDAFQRLLAESGGAHLYSWSYGCLDFGTPIVSMPYEFRIDFLDGHVFSWWDPFARPLSSQGLPTTPLPLIPTDKMTVPFMVNTVDLRWQPPSGIYPMTFIVECQGRSMQGPIVWNDSREPGDRADDQALLERNTSTWDEPVRIATDVPYLALPDPGYEHNRWRVRAQNRLGEGEWCEWREFQKAMSE